MEKNTSFFICFVFISLDRLGIISIFAHELAHTMFGPVNDRGEVAGRVPIDPTPAGNVRLEAIGDYKKPLSYQK
ncbi:MAG: hypothetical protein MUP98_09770 [Candidatus Aminicenantes bacterium]|nr:hypothetical protein [Candidatus Aminicenantes bacterium]